MTEAILSKTNPPIKKGTDMAKVATKGKTVFKSVLRASGVSEGAVLRVLACLPNLSDDEVKSLGEYAASQVTIPFGAPPPPPLDETREEIKEAVEEGSEGLMPPDGGKDAAPF